MQCVGRLVNDSKGVWALPFEGVQEFFHLPIRCTTVASEKSDLCEKCQQRELRTNQKVAALGGKQSIQASHPALLHGRIGGPIPFWSHIYDGSWYRLKIEQGNTVSEQTMVRAKKAALAAPAAEPEALPGGTVQRGRKKAVAHPQQTSVKEFLEVAAPVAEAAAPVAEAVADVVAVAEAAAAAPKKRGPKQVASASVKQAPPTASQKQQQPLAQVQPGESYEVEETVTIQVRPLTIDGRSYYYDPKKEKVYNQHFKYVGRYTKETKTLVPGFPDSDQE
jgi:outer membrane protein OmpA-like peptidoglycan-associated protein